MEIDMPVPKTCMECWCSCVVPNIPILTSNDEVYNPNEYYLVLCRKDRKKHKPFDHGCPLTKNSLDDKDKYFESRLYIGETEYLRRIFNLHCKLKISDEEYIKMNNNISETFVYLRKYNTLTETKKYQLLETMMSIDNFIKSKGGWEDV